MFRRFKGSFYALFFVLINVIYLIIELSFNARLLDASAQMSPTTDFGELEIYGRTISAVGATILAWRLFVPFDDQLKLSRMAIRFMVITLICFPLVFMGQKKLIDTLVDESSNETRRTAQILSLLKFGIANGFVELDELSTNELTMQTAEGKMFVTLSGLLVYSSDAIKRTLENRLNKIAKFATDTQKNRDSEQAYQNYLYARSLILKDYRRYLKLQTEFGETSQNSYDQSIDLYEKAMNSALKNWQNLQIVQQKSEDQKPVSGQSIQLKSLLLQMENQLKFCRNDDCIIEQKNQHLIKINQLLEVASKFEYWCQKKPANSAHNLQISCPNKLQLVESKILHLRNRELARQAGFDQNYQTQAEYLQSEEFRQSVFNSLQQAKITVNPEWKFTEFVQIIENINRQLRDKTNRQYEIAVKKQFNKVLPLRMSVEEFSKNRKFQNILRQALGPIYRPSMPVELNKTDFTEKYMQPLYFLKYDSLINKLQAKDDWYAEGAPYENSGKSGLRNLVVPPVAIAFSLIFGLLNLINLILNLLFYLIEEKRLYRWAGFLLLMILVIIMPLQQHHQIANQQAYISLLQHTEDRFGFAVSGFLNWISKTEPMVYPLGNVLRYNLLEGFSFD